ncbi:hypothetical protein Esti_002017 [Eimeria stiedai]
MEVGLVIRRLRRKLSWSCPRVSSPWHRVSGTSTRSSSSNSNSSRRSSSSSGSSSSSSKRSSTRRRSRSSSSSSSGSSSSSSGSTSSISSSSSSSSSICSTSTTTSSPPGVSVPNSSFSGFSKPPPSPPPPLSGAPRGPSTPLSFTPFTRETDYNNEDFSKYTSPYSESPGLNEIELPSDYLRGLERRASWFDEHVTNPRLRGCVDAVKMGMKMGCVVGGIFGGLTGTYAAIANRNLLVLPLSVMGGALSFGFFLGCGMVIRCEGPRALRGPLVWGPQAGCVRRPNQGVEAPKLSLPGASFLL